MLVSLQDLLYLISQLCVYSELVSTQDKTTVTIDLLGFMTVFSAIHYTHTHIMALKCDQFYDNKKPNISKKWPQVVAILNACLTCFAGGQLYAWTSVGIPYLLSDDFPVDLTFGEVSPLAMVSVITLLIFCPVGSCLVDRIGRKPLLMFSYIPYIISWSLLAFSESLVLFYVARLVAGIGDATISTSLPSYLGEVTEPEIRGKWGNAITINVYVGQFVMNILGSYLTLKTSSLICAIVPIIGIIAMLFLPESPYFLLMQGRHDEARSSLKRLRGMNNVDDELTKLKVGVDRQMSESGTWKDVFIVSTNRKVFFIGIGLRITQVLSGVSVFMVYTQYIFKLAKGGLSEKTSSMLFSGLLVVACVLDSFTLEKFGRRLALFISITGCAMALTTESIYFYCSEYTHLDTSDYNWVPITGLLVYILFFFSGLGSVPSLMLSELFSASIKGKALGIILISSIFISVAAILPFQSLVESYGLFGPFLVYTVCTYLSLFFVYYCIPETKGKSLEEIQLMLIDSSKAKIRINQSDNGA